MKTVVAVHRTGLAAGLLLAAAGAVCFSGKAVIAKLAYRHGVDAVTLLMLRMAIARFQHVLTHPQWRRRGLCRTLVHAVSAHALGEWQAAEVYMAAVPTDVAIGIYRSVGFRPASESFMFQRNAPEDRRGG